MIRKAPEGGLSLQEQKLIIQKPFITGRFCKKRMVTVKKAKGIISILLVIAQCVLLFSTPVFAENSEKTDSGNLIIASETGETNYSKKGFTPAQNPIIITSESETVLRSEQTCDFTVNVPVDSAFNIVLCFKPLSGEVQSVNYSVMIDGKLPFEEAKTLRADCIYENDGQITRLSTGDEIAPDVKHIDDIMKAYAYDITGVESMPYEFSIAKGTHKISITAQDSEFSLFGIELAVPERYISYADYLKANKDKENYNGEQLVLEGESAAYKNDYSVSLRSDTETALITPNDPKVSVINYIGGTTWKDAGQTVTWKFSAPEDGFYKIGASFKQSTIIGAFVYRSLKIDGVTPFEEAACLDFGYSTSWQFKTFGNGEEDYLFYLSKGEHTLSLSVTLGDVSYVFNRLEEIAELLGETYLDVVMITGESPDANRDYELHKQVPDFENKLKKYKKLIDDLSYDVNNVYRVNGELDGALKNMSRVLGDMLSSMYNSHNHIDSYYSYYQTICSWLYDIKNMSMSLDKLIIAAPEKEIDTGRAGFFGRIVFFVKRFLSSMTADYNVVSLNDENAVELKLWVNWGRDQVKVLNSLISRSFSENTGISVRVEQVNASLVQGVVSDNSPDLYLHLSRTEPVNLAMRGVIYDLSKFDDFDEVLTRFQKGAETPYIYRDGVYALPDTQGFNVLFYRKDILDELKIKIPTTWDEFLTATAVVQRKNMNSFLPYTKISSASTVNTGAGGLSIFPTMLMQKGGKVYNEQLNATCLAEPVSVEVFTFWTDFYDKYSLDADTNFYQRFRVGTIPFGVAPYGTYLTLAVSAPEIAGKWAIAEIPGFKDENGTISNICAGSGTGCVIMNSSDHKDEAWEFLKWWTSADTQYEYSANVESVLGESGRVSTATVEALARLDWDRDSLNVIMSQWEKVREIEEAPGSYYVSRSIDQAFWAVYNRKSTPKEAITNWAKVSDNEIQRKIAEYADKVLK